MATILTWDIRYYNTNEAHDDEFLPSSLCEARGETHWYRLQCTLSPGQMVQYELIAWPYADKLQYLSDYQVLLRATDRTESVNLQEITARVLQQAEDVLLSPMNHLMRGLMNV